MAGDQQAATIQRQGQQAASVDGCRNERGLQSAKAELKETPCLQVESLGEGRVQEGGAREERAREARALRKLHLHPGLTARTTTTRPAARLSI